MSTRDRIGGGVTGPRGGGDLLRKKTHFSAPKAPNKDTFFGREAPENGAGGAVLENFGNFSKKVAEKCNRNQFWEKFCIPEKIFRIPLVKRPKNGFDL